MLPLDFWTFGRGNSAGKITKRYIDIKGSPGSTTIGGETRVPYNLRVYRLDLILLSNCQFFSFFVADLSVQPPRQQVYREESTRDMGTEENVNCNPSYGYRKRARDEEESWGADIYNDNNRMAPPTSFSSSFPESISKGSCNQAYSHSGYLSHLPKTFGAILNERNRSSVKRTQHTKIHTEVHQKTVALLRESAKRLEYGMHNKESELVSTSPSESTPIDSSTYYQKPYW